jgi:[CysO sulfur-carrier protein]-S-L-cysteine hydrolase
MLRIERKVLEGLIDHARRELPAEACGYLAGRDGTITALYEMANVDASAEHYSFDAGEQFAVVRDVRSRSLQILAVYHSHPATPAMPSVEDLRLANDPDISYFIVALAGRKAEMKSYKIRNGVAEPEQLDVIDTVSE